MGRRRAAARALAAALPLVASAVSAPAEPVVDGLYCERPATPMCIGFDDFRKERLAE
jgi:hypothetical protein